jgi:hypothetical protein
MPQNTDAQNRTVPDEGSSQHRLKPPDVSRWNALLLVTGVILYLIALAASLLATGTEAGDRAAMALLSLPILIPALMILLGPTVFLVGTITGTPLVSFTYGLSAMK